MQSKKCRVVAVISLAFFALFAVTAHVIAQQKPTVSAGCSIAGCHTPAEGVLRGNSGSVSGKAETIQIDTGAVWIVKFDENTKVVGWQQPLNKLPRNKEIAIYTVMKDGELYAKQVSVKQPVKIPPEKLFSVTDVEKLTKDPAQKGKYMLIDTRPPVRYNEGHIPGAINIWDAHFDKNKDKLPADKNFLIVYYCAGPT